MSIPRNHAKGTAIVMAVGLLVLLAMLGAAFVVVTHMDRKEALSLHNAEPMKTVAASILEKILANRAADMPAAGNADPLSDIDYPSGNGLDSMLCSTEPIFDSAAGGYVWLHLSDIGNLGAVANSFDVAHPPNPLKETNGNLAFLVNAGGEPFYFDSAGKRQFLAAGAFATVKNNAISSDSLMRDPDGRPYFVAVRVVDASAFFNANLCVDWQNAVAGVPINVTNLPMSSLVNQIAGQPYGAAFGMGVRDSLFDAVSGNTGPATPAAAQGFYARYAFSPMFFNDGVVKYQPFDGSDMLSLRGGGSGGFAGRLYGTMNNAALYDAIRPFLTTWSANRLCVPGRINTGGRTSSLRQKADLNYASLDELYVAFQAMGDDIKGSCLTDAGVAWTDADRDRWAAQMACNVVEFRRNDNQPTTFTFTPSGAGAAETAVGVQRQPFLVEASCAEYRATVVPPGTAEKTYALELYNPYASGISIAGYSVEEHDTNNPTPAHSASVTTVTIAPGGRYVLYWTDSGAVNAGKPIYINGVAQAMATGANWQMLTWSANGVNLDKEIWVVRTVGSQRIVIGKIKPEYFATNPSPPSSITPAGGWTGAAGEEAGQSIVRRDNPTDCLYTIARFKNGTIGAGHLIIESSSLLGNSKWDNGPVATTDTNGPDAVYRYTSGTPPVTYPLIGVPIYVRNGPFVSLGDLYRIMTVGPDTKMAIDEKLATPWPPLDPRPSDPPWRLTAPLRMDNGRLCFGLLLQGNVLPNLPMASLISDYFTLNSPAYSTSDNNGNGYVGVCSINNGPPAVLTDGASPNWAPGVHVGKRVVINGQVRRVTASTANALTLDYPFNPAIAGGNYLLDPVDDVVYGQININTAPRAEIEALLNAVSPLDATKTQLIVDDIIGYRDGVVAYDVGNKVCGFFGTMPMASPPGATPLKGLHHTSGMLATAEVALAVAGEYNVLGAPLPPGAASNTPYAILALGDGGTSEDGLPVNGAAARKDLTYYMAHYTWLANLFTARSDVYIAYICVDVRNPSDLAANPIATRRYVALIDRSNVRGGQGPNNVATFAAGNNQLTDAAQTWGTNSWAGAKVEILTGGGKGQIRGILGNTGNALTLDSNWDVASDPNTKYRIYYRPNVLFFSAVN